MRKLPVAVATSAVLHGAAVAWVGIHEPSPRVAPADPDPIVVEIVAAAPTPEPPVPIDVALVEPARSMVSPELSPSKPRERRHEIEVRAASVEVPGAVEPAVQQPPRSNPERGAGGAASAAPRSKMFEMRSGERPNLTLRPTFRDDLDNPPAGTRPDPGVTPTGQLQPAGGGTYRAEEGPFTARIAEDGGVTMKDRRNFRLRIALPTPKSVGKGIATWYESDKGPDGKRGIRSLEKDVGGSIDKEDRSKAVIIPVISAGFDVTDWLMRSNKIDPYASRKLAFLDSTRDERVQIGTGYRARQLAQTSIIVQRNLERLWARVIDPAARRQALFEVWDEIVETGDPKIVEAGVAARKQIIGFIRARLPTGGPSAYPADELATLNRARASQAVFAPYE